MRRLSFNKESFKQMEQIKRYAKRIQDISENFYHDKDNYVYDYVDELIDEIDETIRQMNCENEGVDY
jgi:hypothetical protein